LGLFPTRVRFGAWDLGLGNFGHLGFHFLGQKGGLRLALSHSLAWQGLGPHRPWICWGLPEGSICPVWKRPPIQRSGSTPFLGGPSLIKGQHFQPRKWLTPLVVGTFQAPGLKLGPGILALDEGPIWVPHHLGHHVVGNGSHLVFPLVWRAPQFLWPLWFVSKGVPLWPLLGGHLGESFWVSCETHFVLGTHCLL